MLKNTTILLFVLSVINFSCQEGNDLNNQYVEFDNRYSLERQIIDSVTVYTYEGRIDDTEEATTQIQKFENILDQASIPSEDDFTNSPAYIRFINNSTVSVKSNDEPEKRYSFIRRNNLFSINKDTLVSYGYDQGHKDYAATQYQNTLVSIKPSFASQKEATVGYNKLLETKVINQLHLYGQNDKLIVPQLYYVHLTPVLGKYFVLQEGFLNNLLDEDAFQVLNQSDQLLVYHYSKIYQKQ